MRVTAFATWRRPILISPTSPTDPDLPTPKTICHWTHPSRYRRDRNRQSHLRPHPLHRCCSHSTAAPSTVAKRTPSPIKTAVRPERTKAPTATFLHHPHRRIRRYESSSNRCRPSRFKTWTVCRYVLDVGSWREWCSDIHKLSFPKDYFWQNVHYWKPNHMIPWRRITYTIHSGRVFVPVDAALNTFLMLGNQRANFSNLCHFEPN